MQSFCKILSILIFVLSLCSGSLVHAEETKTVPIISEIKISGNRLITEQEIKDILVVQENSLFNEEAVVADLKKIYDLGYFKKESLQVKPSLKPDGTILLEYVVEENPPVTDLVVYGNNHIKEIDAYAYFQDLVAKPENAKVLTERIKALERSFIEKGYIVAKVKDLDLDSSGLLKIYVDEGLIHEITYSGNNKTQESYLDHLVSNTNLDEPYNETKFIKDYNKLNSTGYFSNVNRVVKPSDQYPGYELEIAVKEKEKNTQLGIGGGVNSSAGFFGNANTSIGNLRGKGESLTINATLGSGYGAGYTFNPNSNLVRRGGYTQIGASYNIPFFRDSDYTLSNSINYTRGPNFNIDLSRQSLMSAQASLSKSVGTHHRFKIGAGANHIDVTDLDRKKYLDTVTDNILESGDITNEVLFNASQNGFLGGKSAIARAIAKEIRDQQIVSGFYTDLKMSYTYQDLDQATRPRSGWTTTFGLTPSLGVGEIGSWTKANASISRYFPLPKESTLIVNIRGGQEILGTLPQFDKFRLGTFAGVRGYRQFSQLGAGNKLFISSTELRTPIYNIIPQARNVKFLKGLGFATFADLGLVGGDIKLNRYTNRLSQAASVGFGLRVNLPLVGALRLDLGFPLVQALTGQDKLFRFNFGPSAF